MQTYRVKATVSDDGTIVLTNVPFQAGEEVEIVVRERPLASHKQRYPLHGKTIRYLNPFDSVAEDEWNALQ